MGYNSGYEGRSDDSRNHGAEVRISLSADSLARVLHSRGCFDSVPTIRSYREGIRIGCTFVTSEALRKIWDWHQDFSAATSKTHQQGAE